MIISAFSMELFCVYTTLSPLFSFCVILVFRRSPVCRINERIFCCVDFLYTSTANLVFLAVKKIFCPFFSFVTNIYNNISDYITVECFFLIVCLGNFCTFFPVFAYIYIKVVFSMRFMWKWMFVESRAQVLWIRCVMRHFRDQGGLIFMYQNFSCSFKVSTWKLRVRNEI